MALLGFARGSCAQEPTLVQQDMLALSLADAAESAGTTGAVFDAEMSLTPGPPPTRRTFWLAYNVAHGPRKYLEWLWKDPINLYTRPFFWGSDGWETFGIEAGITGVLIPADKEVRDFVQRNRQKALSDVLKNINDYYGSVDLVYGGAGLFVIGLAAGNEKIADAGFLSAESVFYATQLATITKNVFGRERPKHAKDQWQFHGWDRHNHSFVSGDAIVAFAFSSSVSEVWQNPWITWPAYGLAIGVAAARVDRNAHWLSDVVGAAFLGTAVGKSLVHFHYHRNAQGVVVPYIGDHEVGLQAAIQF